MNRKILLIGLIALMCAALSKSVIAQKATIVKEGVGIENVVVGKSTKADVEKNFGKKYKWVKNKKYSYQMIYPNGVSFYFCQSEKQPPTFDIEMRSPFAAKTSRGVTLRESTLADVQKIYGKAKTGLRYHGIEFYYEKIGGKKVVTVIDVVETKGLRQCKVENTDKTKKPALKAK